MELRRKRNEKRGARGTAMLEMVIVLPLLLLLIFAMCEFGLAFGRWITVNNAAREGARKAIVYRDGCTATQVHDEVVAAVQAYTNASLGMSVPASDITVLGACTDPPSLDSKVKVTVPYTFQIVGAISPALAMTLDLVGASVMRNEG